MYWQGAVHHGWSGHLFGELPDDELWRLFWTVATVYLASVLVDLEHAHDGSTRCCNT